MSGIAIILLAIAYSLLGIAVISLHRSADRRIEKLEREVRAMKRYGR